MVATQKDIADKLGISVATVSRALGGYSDIAKSTQERVKEVAGEMGYSPNITARQLQKRRTDTIGLILPSENLRISDPFFSEFLSGIMGESTQYGMDLLVSIHPSTKDETELYLNYIRSRRVDGFIVTRTQRQDPRIDLLREHNFPFAAFGRVDGDNDFPLIDENGKLGVQLAVDHLVELGHTRMAFISEPTHLTKAYHRLSGFCRAIELHGLTIDQDLIIEGGFRQRSGHLIGEQLLDMSNPPTAIVACNDLLALGAMRAIQERGLVVGKDISVTGFDDIALAEYVHPPLTTCHQPARQIGKMIYQMLVKEINQESPDKRQIILKPELVVRQSTGPVQK